MSKRVNRTLTVKQKRIFDFITASTSKNGYAPSLEEIAGHFRLKAISTVHSHIKALKNKGYLIKEENQPRGLSSFQRSSETVEIPLLGFIAAGKPIEPIENPEPIQVAKSMVANNGNYYALRVQGNSMMDMGVLDNDIVLIRHQLNADIGDVIVAITEKGATLKVLRKKGKDIILEPKNKDYPVIKPERLEIRGKFVGLIRNSG